MSEVNEKVSLDSLVKPEVIELEEEFYARNSHTVKKRVEETLDMGCRRIVIDFHKTKVVDSVSLETLLWASEKAQETNSAIKIARLNETVRKIFELVQFDKAFDIYDDVNSAMSAFQ